MNTIKHFKTLQAQYMPKRVFGSNINNMKLIKKLLREQKNPRIDKSAIFKSELPAHLKKYPNFVYKTSDIINVETRVKGIIELKDLTQKIKVKKEKYKIPDDVDDVRQPIHDYIDFKQMSGNEIILNMSNSEYFRDSELINSLYELALRMNLKTNQEVKDYDIVNHPYIGKALNQVHKHLFNYKVFYFNF